MKPVRGSTNIWRKLLPNAGSSFLYKMLRKKNIVVNGKKADGSEKLSVGDVLKIYFSDETFAKFAPDTAGAEQSQSKEERLRFYRSLPKDKLDIIYEDEDILLINKPSGMLSQKAGTEDISANEYLIAYLLGQRSAAGNGAFHFPAIHMQPPGSEYLRSADRREILKRFADTVRHVQGTHGEKVLPLRRKRRPSGKK